MRALGIDPGTRRTGWGIVTVVDGVIRRIDSGVIAPSTKLPLEQRLIGIHSGLVEQIERYQPDAAAVEDIFFARHPQGALKLGHARGVALLAVAQKGVEVSSYPPAKVKRSIAGHGRADKGQINRLVTMLLRLGESPKEDESDALALSICHLTASGQLVGSRR